MTAAVAAVAAVQAAAAAAAATAPVQTVKMPAAMMDVPKQAEILSVVLICLRTTVLGVKAAMMKMPATAAVTAVTAAAAVHNLMKQVVEAVVCPGDRTTACSAWQMRGILRETTIISSFQYNSFGTPTV